MLNRGLDKQELLRVVDSVANEKSIDKELILSSMETAIQRAAYSKFGTENEIEAQIDRKSGNIKIQKVLIIVDKVEDPAREISIKDASSIQKQNEDLKVGDKVLYGKYSGTEVTIENEDYLIMKENDIFAII